MPLLIVVRRVILRDHSLFQRTGEESYVYHERLPASTYKLAKIIHEPWWANNFNAVTYLRHSSKTLAKLERASMETQWYCSLGMGPFDSINEDYHETG